jgi:hypothetical protein
MNRNDDIAVHVAGARSSETAALIARVSRVLWPTGTADRVEPAALPWLRLWTRPRQPLRPGSVPLCECATGRCLICN